MRITDMLTESVRGIATNKARSGLTMLGIVIGIASVIAMVAMGQGSTDSITASIESAGANLITVSPGFSQSSGPVRGGRSGATTLTVEDADAIAELSDVAAVAPTVTGSYQVVATTGNTNTQVISTTPAYTTVHNLDLSEGTFFSDSQVSNASRVAVLGSQVATDIFGDPNSGGVAPVGQTLRINGTRFKVIGVAAGQGGSGFSNTDDMIYIPLLTGQKLLAGQTTYVSSVGVAAAAGEVMTQVQTAITNLLLQRHGISDVDSADFSVANQSAIAESAASTTQTLTILLAAVAGISLVVGGVGIMNMMLTTVNERTREIGLRKAIGAKRRDISLQFLTEAVMLTFASGIMGIILGRLAAYLMTRFTGTATSVTGASVALAFGVSVAIGIVFGFYPAQRAARMNPIEALRYE